MRGRSRRTVIVYALIAALALTTVAYALLSATLNIGGTVVQQGGTWKIYFDNLSAPTVVGDAKAISATLVPGSTSFTFKASVFKPLDSITYTFEVVNDGIIDALLSDMVFKNVNIASSQDIVYSLTYASDGAEVKAGDILLAESSKVLKLTLAYDDVDTIVNSSEPLDLGITLVYVQKEGGSINGDIYDDSVQVMAPNLLNNSLVPVVYDTTKNNGAGAWVVADTTKTWYNYSNGQWANAVILEDSVTKNVGDTVTVPTETSTSTEVKAMYVWIPRYEYKIEGSYGTHTDGTAGTRSFPGEIKVNFISTSQTSASNGYILHPAFQWDKDSNGTISTSEHISGMWVGKFETTGTSSKPTVLPNLVSLRNQNISNQFKTAQKFGTYLTNSANTDSHMMKNSEWGAVAYLSQSIYGKYGNSMYTGTKKKVYVNNSSSYYTGRSGDSSTGIYTANGTCYYNDITDRGSGTGACGAGASTTGNIYGVYDMAQGAAEYVMGYYTGANSNYASNPNTYFGWDSLRNYAGFTSKPDNKYFDAYTTNNSSTACNGSICYGHALSETSGWENVFSSSNFIYAWQYRGDYAMTQQDFDNMILPIIDGSQNDFTSFRSVLLWEPSSSSSGSTKYTDPILAGSDPNLLNDSLTPVVYDSTKNNGAGAWVVADTTTEWYNYAEQEWANAVILESGVTKNVGDTVTVPTATSTTTEVKAMYVWIPRYEYKIEGEYGTHTNGTAGTAELPGAIDINFISTSTTSASSGYILHPAFTWDNDSNGTISTSENISGIWVGKFETTGTSSKPTVLPNLVSLRNQNISNQFTTAQKFSTYLTNSTNADSHMMKNSEWGAVAYLSQSIYGKYGNGIYTGANKEVYINNSLNGYTGRSGGSSDETATETGTCYYDDITDRGSGTGACGAGASTTGNIYGVYDMSGGTEEYVMGYLTIANSNYESNPNSYFGWTAYDNPAGFTSKPDNKYFDAYTTDQTATACSGGICYGHALRETFRWYSDIEGFVDMFAPWFGRGGSPWDGASAGAFCSFGSDGDWYEEDSFRGVLLVTGA